MSRTQKATDFINVSVSLPNDYAMSFPLPPMAELRTISDFQKCLYEVSYKKNFMFSIEDYGSDLSLLLSARVTCAITGRDDSVGFSKMEQKHKINTREKFHKWLYDCVVELEMHEVQEFFQVNKRHLVDPHPELQRYNAYPAYGLYNYEVPKNAERERYEAKIDELIKAGLYDYLVSPSHFSDEFNTPPPPIKGSKDDENK